MEESAVSKVNDNPTHVLGERTVYFDSNSDSKNCEKTANYETTTELNLDTCMSEDVSENMPNKRKKKKQHKTKHTNENLNPAELQVCSSKPFTVLNTSQEAEMWLHKAKQDSLCEVADISKLKESYASFSKESATSDHLSAFAWTCLSTSFASLGINNTGNKTLCVSEQNLPPLENLLNILNGKISSHNDDLSGKTLEYEKTLAVAAAVLKRRELEIQQLKMLIKDTISVLELEAPKVVVAESAFKENANLKESLAKNNKRIAELENIMEDERKTFSQLKSSHFQQLQNFEVEISNLREENEKLAFELEETKAELDTCKEANVKMNAEIEELKIALEKEKTANAELQGEWNKKIDDIRNQLEEEFAEERQLKQDAEDSMKNMQAELDKLMEENADVRSHLIELKSERESLQASLEKSELEKKEIQMQQKSVFQKQLSSIVVEAEKKLKTLAADVKTKHETEVFRLKAKFESVQEAEKKEHEIAVAKIKQSFEIMLQDERKKLSEALCKISDLQKEIKKLELVRSQLLSRMQHLLETQWQEALHMFYEHQNINTPQKKKKSSSQSSLETAEGINRVSPSSLTTSRKLSPPLFVQSLTTSPKVHYHRSKSPSSLNQFFARRKSLPDYSEDVQITRKAQPNAAPRISRSLSLEDLQSCYGKKPIFGNFNQSDHYFDHLESIRSKPAAADSCSVCSDSYLFCKTKEGKKKSYALRMEYEDNAKSIQSLSHPAHDEFRMGGVMGEYAKPQTHFIYNTSPATFSNNHNIDAFSQATYGSSGLHKFPASEGILPNTSQSLKYRIPTALPFDDHPKITSTASQDDVCWIQNTNVALRSLNKQTNSAEMCAGSGLQLPNKNAERSLQTAGSVELKNRYLHLLLEKILGEKTITENPSLSGTSQVTNGTNNVVVHPIPAACPIVPTVQPAPLAQNYFVPPNLNTYCLPPFYFHPYATNFNNGMSNSLLLQSQNTMQRQPRKLRDQQPEKLVSNNDLNSQFKDLSNDAKVKSSNNIRGCKPPPWK